MHGREEVVVVSAEESLQLESDRSGGALIAALQASPWREIDIEPPTDAGS